VAWNDDRPYRDDGQIPLGCTDHSVDTAIRSSVDERIKAVPPCVSDVNNVSLFERAGDIAICGAGRVNTSKLSGVVVMHMVFVIQTRYEWRRWAGGKV